MSEDWGCGGGGGGGGVRCSPTSHIRMSSSTVRGHIPRCSSPPHPLLRQAHLKEVPAGIQMLLDYSQGVTPQASVAAASFRGTGRASILVCREASMLQP